MKQRMKYVFVLALAAGSMALSACGDDDSSSENNNGGSAGASGSKTGGSSPGGSANKAGNNSGGKASAGGGAGGAADGGMGGASEAGAGVGGDSAGAGGNVDMGGAAGASGAAGAGGAGQSELVYACGSATLIQKKCSAMVAANCDLATDCSDCVATATSDREAFQTDPPCDTCNAKWDAFDQCEVDAFESGNLSAGVECVDGIGADGTLDCYPFLDDAIACEGYVGSDADPHACPATWPPPQ